MEGSQTEICPNCNRDIPVDNYMIHSVHCARNIRMCPVCKEPVPASDLEDHHARMHKLLPCKKCGEGVCGADLEDHVRDSCALTARPCRHCQLELPRGDLPPHEAYCGSRTEPCPDCGDYVMIKYRQLHLDTDHAFLKLDDEPGPEPRNDSPAYGSPSSRPDGPILRAALSGPTRNSSSTSIPHPSQETANMPRFFHIPSRLQSNLSSRPGPAGLLVRPSSSALYMGPGLSIMPPGQPISPSPFPQPGRQLIIGRSLRPNSTGQYIGPGLSIGPSSSGQPTSPSPFPQPSRQRLSDQPVGSSPSNPSGRPGSDFPRSPFLPTNPSDSDQSDASEPDVPSSSSQVGSMVPAVNNKFLPKNMAMAKRMNDQPQINTSVAASSKVNKDLSRQQRSLMKKRPAPQPPPEPEDSDPTLARDLANWQFRRNRDLEESIANLEELRRLEALNKAVPRRTWMGRGRGFIPMSSEEFRNRFEHLRLRTELQESMGSNELDSDSVDRFNEIKRDLQELRRGLNEVTAPYNAGRSYSPFLSPEQERRFLVRRGSASPEPAEPEPPSEDTLDMEVELPCEFCGGPWPAHQLVQHQSGCRIEYRPESRSPSPPRPRSARPPPSAAEPVIPCEFCARSLPLRQIAAHQLTCSQLPNTSGLELPD